jgi:hypothetical protein
MTYTDVADVVHYVHATHTSTIEKFCGGKTSYLPHELSDSNQTLVTCLFCITKTGWWKRPPFEPGDPRADIAHSLAG